ncbi:MAG: glutamine synthetase type III, partial [Lachnospiraceae bacterium]|nr:glutamine synthetase type III [Lachnospiraceae bacterium]
YFMEDLNKHLWEYGVPAKTQHNEAAPAQHEIAPIFGTTNIANDQNQIVMETLKKVADRTGFACLLHEKPFAGINGSGKHNNWSLSTSDGENLIDPGKEPETNLQFQVFLAAILEAVDNHPELLRMSAACPGNDHRLGALEAPPAIISAYLGDQLGELVNQIIENGEPGTSPKRKLYRAGCSVIPEFKMDATDRNRTSPFAFTGNKFEFRMVGSTQSVAQPMMVLNTIVAEALSDFADVLEKADDFEAAAKQLVVDKLREHKRIIFNGDGYSKEWIEESAKRGLPNIPTMVEAIDYFVTDENIRMFEKHGVLSEVEMRSREIVLYESYAKQINLEALTMIEMSKRQIIPAVLSYEGSLASSVKDLKTVGVSADAQLALIRKIDEQLALLMEATDRLEEITQKAAEYKDDPKAWAFYYHDEVFSFFDTVRTPADKLEKLVAADAWPLPTYEEMLFEQ